MNVTNEIILYFDTAIIIYHTWFFLHSLRAPPLFLPPSLRPSHTHTHIGKKCTQEIKTVHANSQKRAFVTLKYNESDLQFTISSFHLSYLNISRRYIYMEIKVIFSVHDNYNVQIKSLTVMDLKRTAEHVQLRQVCSVKNLEQICKGFFFSLLYFTHLAQCTSPSLCAPFSFHLTCTLISSRSIQRCTLTNYPSLPPKSPWILVKAFRQVFS